LKDTVPPSASRISPAGGEDPVDEFLSSEDAAAPCGRGNAGRSDGRCPILRVRFQSLRASLIESMPACRHHKTDIELQRS